MFDATSQRYLHGPAWAACYRGKAGILHYQLTPDIRATIHDSDPMWLAVYWLDGEPVAGESCITNPDEWATRTRADGAFLNRIRGLRYHPG